MWVWAVAAVAALGSLRAVEGGLVEVFWNVSYVTIAPDCVTKTVPAINGQYPGPPIHAVTGDRIRAKVCNDMYWPITMHWHGLHMKGQQWMDGAALASQCPIPTGECFTYDFVVNGQHGTFWYHGHMDIRRSSLYGPLIISPKENSKVPFPKPAGDYHVLLNDWYHRYSGDIVDGIFNKTYVSLGQPDSILVNGRGVTWCKQYVCPPGYEGTWKCGKCDRKSTFCNPFSSFVVKPGGTYRFRIVNVALLAQMNFKIEGHNFTLVMNDGWYLKPVVVDSLDIDPGQSYDILLTADQKPRNYWIGINGRYNTFVDPPGLAVLKYEDSPVFNNTQPWWFPFPTGPDESDKNFGLRQQKSLKNLHTFPKLAKRKVDRYFSIQWNEVSLDGYFRYAVNNYSFVAPSTPALYQAYMNQTDFFEKNEIPHNFAVLDQNEGTLTPEFRSNVLTVKKGDFVQIVLQNNPNGLHHPWHLHGYDFYTVGHGKGLYNISLEQDYENTYNLIDPPVRNTVTVYSDTWVAIRFVADNVGVWNMHCHMDPHVDLGLQLYLRVVGEKGDIPPPPKGVPKCGVLS